MDFTYPPHPAASHQPSKQVSPPPPYHNSVGAGNSLDITQRIERKLAHYNASQSIFKRWLFEIISIATSALCMGKVMSELDRASI
jgi:hypothetical protein